MVLQEILTWALSMISILVLGPEIAIHLGHSMIRDRRFRPQARKDQETTEPPEKLDDLLELLRQLLESSGKDAGDDGSDDKDA